MNSNFRNKALALTFGAIFLVFGVYAVLQSQKQYIGGNIIHLPLPKSANNDRVHYPFTNSSLITGLLYRNLFIAKNSLMEYQPDLAEAFTVSDDGLNYTIKLKDGQTWSDGEAITADDFLFTVEALRNATRTYLPVVLVALNEIKEISATGNDISITLHQAHFNFMPMLAQIPLLPKHKLGHLAYNQLEEDDFWKNPVTSGMYKVDIIEPEDKIELSINELYNGQKPKIEQVHFHYNHATAPLDMYSSNNISDIVFYRSMRNKFTEYPVDVLFYRYLAFNVQGNDGHFNPNMQDKRIREAICYAIDNIGLASSIYFDSAEIAENLTKDSANFLVYNPQKAKELIKEVGYNLSKPLRLGYYYSDDTSVGVMRFMQKNLEAVGFKVELVHLTSHEQIYSERKYDVLYKGLPPFSRFEWYNEYNSNHPLMASIIDTKDDYNDILQQLSTASDEDVAQELLDELYQKDRDTLFKFVIYQPMHTAYINTERVELPNDVKFLNPWYKSSISFEDWEIKKR